MKRRQVVPQRRGAAARAKTQSGELPRAPFQPEGRFTYLTAEEAASYLRFDVRAQEPARAFAQWAAREGIPVCKRGRVSLWLVADLDDAVQAPRQARKQMQLVHGGRS